MGMKIRNVGGYGIKIRDNVKEKPGYGADPSRPSENRGIHIECCEIDTTGMGGIYLAAQDSTISENAELGRDVRNKAAGYRTYRGESVFPRGDGTATR